MRINGGGVGCCLSTTEKIMRTNESSNDNIKMWYKVKYVYSGEERLIKHFVLM